MSTDGAWESEKKMCSGMQTTFLCTSVPRSALWRGEMDGKHQPSGEISNLAMRGHHVNGINPVLPAQMMKGSWQRPCSHTPGPLDLSMSLPGGSATPGCLKLSSAFLSNKMSLPQTIPICWSQKYLWKDSIWWISSWRKNNCWKTAESSFCHFWQKQYFLFGITFSL